MGDFSWGYICKQNMKKKNIKKTQMCFFIYFFFLWVFFHGIEYGFSGSDFSIKCPRFGFIIANSVDLLLCFIHFA